MQICHQMSKVCRIHKQWKEFKVSDNLLHQKLIDFGILKELWREKQKEISQLKSNLRVKEISLRLKLIQDS